MEDVSKYLKDIRADELEKIGQWNVYFTAEKEDDTSAYMYLHPKFGMIVIAHPDMETKLKKGAKLVEDKSSGGFWP